ncbi:HlyD family secretion protein [marine gamma proteobacterium HTCC2080]|nr:HlyD family secretion protein [marine gamma proteobacterium HTCC2080]
MRTKATQFISVVSGFLLGRQSELASDEDAELLDSDRRARRFGYAVILVVFGGFGAWAGLAPIESAVHGVGTVQVEGNRKVVQHLEGGIVTEILVSNGDFVTKGQALLRMDETQVKAELSIISGRFWAKRALVDRLLAERDDKKDIAFTPWLKKLGDERVLVAIGNEKALFNARRTDLAGEKELFEQRIAQLRDQVKGFEAVLTAKRSVAASLGSEATELEELLEEGYVDKQRIRELERSQASILGEVSDQVARISAAKIAIEEMRLQILQLGKGFQTRVVNALTQEQEILFDLEQQYHAVSARAARMVVRAPNAGTILALESNTIGEVFGPGQQIMAIVPDTDSLLIDTKLSPMDIDRISIGQEAEVRFSVFKDAYSITGVLVKLSADSLLDESNGAPYFQGKVRLLEGDIALLGANKLVPGMPAEVLVKTGERTLLGYLSSPLHRMFEASLIEE